MSESTMLDVAFRVAADDVTFLSFVDHVAAHYDVPARELKLRSLLQLPRFADADGIVDAVEAAKEIEALASEMPHTAEWLPAKHLPPVAVGRLRFGAVDEVDAAYISTRFHYIRRHRANAQYFGLFRPELELPVALFVVSPIDGATKQLVELDDGRAQWNVARVFSFHDAPKNVISFGLARLGEYLSCDGPIQLTTHVNPNVGFKASSYLASNWVEIGREPFEYYSYVNGAYVTEREVGSVIAQLSFEAASRRFPTPILVSVSSMRLDHKRTFARCFPSTRVVGRSRTVTSRSQLPIAMFDGDDVLWETQQLFDTAIAEVAEVVAEKDIDIERWSSVFVDVELRNLETLGFRKERFPSSCVEAYQRLEFHRNNPFDPATEDEITWAASLAFSRPPRVRPGAHALLSELRSHFRLAYFVQGDPELQRSRLRASGLAEYFDIVSIHQRRAAKEVQAFVELYPARRHILIGNSVPIDIVPAVKAGVEAVHFEAKSWVHEAGPLPPNIVAPSVRSLSEIASVVD